MLKTLTSDAHSAGVAAVIRSLGGGGAERVLTSMLNYWAERGRKPWVITTTEKERHAYPLHPDVRCATIPPINTPNILDDCPWNIPLLRETLIASGCAAVISFMEKSNIATILAASGLPIKIVIAERTDPRTQTEYSDYKRAIIRRLYPLADDLVVQTKAVKEGWADLFMPPGKTVVIRNTVSVDLHKHSMPLPEKFICCMGRLTHCKGFSGLLDIFADIARKHRNLHLIILGEGPDRAALEEKIRLLGLGERVLLPGFIRQPHAILARSELFLLPSVFEGYPNALIEAMALGLPCISFDCLSGPSEIITHNKNGVLVPAQDYAAMRERALELLADKERRAVLGARARESVLVSCQPDIVMRQWDKLVYKKSHESRLIENNEQIPAFG